MMTALAAIETHFESVEDPRDPDLIDHLPSDSRDHLRRHLWSRELGRCRQLGQRSAGMVAAIYQTGDASHDTFRRVFLAIDPAQFQTGFQGWIS